MTRPRYWRKELLERAEALAADVEEMSTNLVGEYDKFVATVLGNGLARGINRPWQTTFEVPSSTAGLEWRPDTGDTRDIGFGDGEDIYFMPKAYLVDPEAWLQGALAAHGQHVADGAAAAERMREARKADLRRQLAELEASE